MSKYNLTAFVRETIINYNEETSTTSIYTCSPPLMRRMDEKVEKFPEYFKLVKEDEYSKTYQCDKKYVSIRNPKILTQEQKDEISNRLSKARENKDAT